MTRYRGSFSFPLRTLKGHSDDVSRFVVKDGLLLSGSRDANLIGWDAGSGEFLFAKRYCHRGDISAIDVVRDVVVTGSRDTTVKVWSLNGFVGENNNPVRLLRVQDVSVEHTPMFTLIRRRRRHCLRCPAQSTWATASGPWQSTLAKRRWWLVQPDWAESRLCTCLVFRPPHSSPWGGTC